MLPCNGIHVSFGNVREETLSSILARGRSYQFFKKIHDGCPPAEDKEFIRKMLSKTQNSSQYPIEYTELFGEEEECMVNFDWKKQVVLIAGGSYEGVSKAMALKAEQLGAKTIVLARTRKKNNEIYYREGNIFVFPCDFQDIENVRTLYSSIISETGFVPTIFINDVRYQIAGYVGSTPIDSYLKSYRANALFIVAMVQAILPDMMRQGYGKIVNILSAVIYHSYPGVSAYFAAKSALGAIHESLRSELVGMPVKTLYVRPGGFLSNYWKNTVFGSRINDFLYPTIEDLRDTEYLVSSIFKAIEADKVEINLGSVKDRLGFHMSYWTPNLLDKVIEKRNKRLIKKEHENPVEARSN